MSKTVDEKKTAFDSASKDFNTKNDALPALQKTLADAEKALVDNKDPAKTSDLRTAVDNAMTALKTPMKDAAEAKTALDKASNEFNDATAKFMGVGEGLDSKTLEIGLQSQKHAQAAIGELESFMQDITSVRSAFGANINRLEHTVNNLSNMKENTDIAKGRIMDADFATESTNMTKNQMLMQAGMSVLGQANQMTGMVTGLLR